MIHYTIERRSAKPVYIQLKDTLKEAIEDGRLKPLSQMPLVTQIAEDAGVSLRTADNALRELIKEGLCFRRPKKGTFVRGKNVIQKQKVCGILGNIDPVSYPLQTLLYCGIMEAAVRAGHLALVIPSPLDDDPDNSPEAVIQRYDRSSEFEMVGVFIVDVSLYDEAVRLAERFPEKRFFYLNYQGEEFRRMPANMAAVVNDDFTGAYQLAEYIFSEYKPASVLVLTMPLRKWDITYQERCRGYREASKEYSVEYSGVLEMKFCSSMNDQLNTAYQTVKNYFKKGNMTDFIFCVNDLFAYGAKRAVEELGLQERVQISGYDCIHNLPDYSVPSVKVCYTEMGKKGFEKMLKEDVKMQTITKLPPEIIRKSNIAGAEK